MYEYECAVGYGSTASLLVGNDHHAAYLRGVGIVQAHPGVEISLVGFVCGVGSHFCASGGEYCGAEEYDVSYLHLSNCFLGLILQI